VAKTALSDSIQDYLKSIYNLGSGGDRVAVTELARRQSVSPASASAMVKKLAALSLVEHVPYRGVTLTPAGERIALEVIRHHRLLELYLAETLGLGIDAVHAEADRLEHVLSEELEARIDRALGFPTHDPHGDPIPNADLELAASDLRALSDLEPGEKGLVRRIPDGDPVRLRHLSRLGLVPGRRVELRRAKPLTVIVDGAEHVIAAELAAQIGVS
jgi:DtxR family Mn-dependent transcriptional regulator